MTVDFEKGKVPAMKAATVGWTGNWDEKRIRKELEGLADWANDRGVRTGRWILTWKGPKQFRAAIELSGPARGSGRVRVRSYPATSVVSVTFNPDELSPRVVYHGLADHLRWQKRQKEVTAIGETREVYRGNPWKDKGAWARTRVETIVRR